VVRVLTWNLFHGRADPPAGRPLLHEFATTLAGWDWDVALLQEVPPWWPPLLARACGADARSARTSRNALLPVRRAIASRRPDLLKSNGGGADAILVRPPLRITAHGVRRLRVWPERRVVHAVRVAVGARAPAAGADGRTAGVDGPAAGAAGSAARFDGRAAAADGWATGADERAGGTDLSAWDSAWIGNVHGQKGHWDDAAGLAPPLADLHEAIAALGRWCAPVVGPVLLGGDLNLPREVVGTALPAGWSRVASSGPDHVVGRGVTAASDSSRPDRGALSDHAALAVPVRRT